MQLTGKNTGIASKNTRQNAGKNNRKRRKKYLHNRIQKNLQFHAELPAIAGNLPPHRG